MPVPTLVTIPCFSGARWDARQIEPLTAAGLPMLNLRLPDDLDTVDGYADFVAAEVAPLGEYVLVGDSFGAVIALALAVRRPTGLRGLVLSGGFAASPLPRWKTLAAQTARFAGGPLYSQGVLRYHAHELASRFDRDAEVPHRQSDYRRLFAENTPRRAYVARVTSVTGFDVRDELAHVDVPTLLITPEDDRLVGRAAAEELRAGLPAATEVILAGTGHMFRFTHPQRYGAATVSFLRENVGVSAPVGTPSAAHH